MTPAQQISLWADQLRDMSAGGLLFSKSIYDRENYETIQAIAREMLALATAQSLDQLEPLRVPVFERITPLCGGDAAIVDPHGKILLIRRADNRQWAMPGGWLSVGETPAQGAVREAFEETGVRCQPVALVGIHDSRLCGTISPFHLYHFSFLCEPLYGGEAERVPSHAQEILDSQWFGEDELPRDVDPGHITRIRQAYRVWHGDVKAYFD